MIEDAPRILCANCRTHLYYFDGEFKHGTYPKPEQFRPVSSGIPAPRRGEKMLCVKCGKPWYLVKENGSLLVMTNQGWRPRDPVGRKEYDGYSFGQPEMPPELVGSKSEYRDPVEMRDAQGRS